jgi:hypothetical protein
MGELSPEGEDLVRTGRQADLPSDADRERVLRALEARLGLPAAGGAAAGALRGDANPVGGWLRSRWIARTGFVGLAGLAGAALFFALRGPSSPRASASSPAVTSSVSTTVTPVASTDLGIGQTTAPNDGEERTAATARAIAPRNTPPSAHAPEGQRPSASINARPSDAARTAHPQSSLSEEVALLSHAETDLHAGHFESALRSLDEHERRFPHGALEQERTAARAQALVRSADSRRRGDLWSSSHTLHPIRPTKSEHARLAKTRLAEARSRSAVRVPQTADRARSAAWTVRSTSSSVCAPLTNAASN